MTYGFATPGLRAALLGAAILAAPSGHAQGSGGDIVQPMPDDLSALRWEARPVLLFAASANDAAYTEQLAALREARAGLADREIVVLADTSPDMNGALRQRFGPDGFLFVLVGKDGGVKRTETAPIAAGSLFDTIDAMPMRQREMSE
ncbi:DUF4174 domain-containing protein [Roseivivax marinus]|uniref:DUF4174 domain-containing protein n=1 Tax=Roseivivax marinus TaxID=1379903 RepID=UPI001F033BD0|nr:DUF4174 domain-containing protein [Roseivivax marinus]UMA64881.1 DUF4174 domain-containing protein [Roseivivax marinus]